MCINFQQMIVAVRARHGRELAQPNRISNIGSIFTRLQMDVVFQSPSQSHQVALFTVQARFEGDQPFPVPVLTL